jgi:GntR family transcriptional repressor for pyruvate dehydrogenase complex
VGNQTDLFQSLKLRRERLHKQIADSIQEMIAENQLRPGDQLLSERELAKLLGVNRATVREAIRLLEQLGLVQMKVGSGTYITNMPRSVVAESIERYFVFGSCSHHDLITLRDILEPEMAALAAEHATPEDLTRLKELVEQIEDTFARDEIKNYAAADTGFHEALAIATHNALIIAIASGLEKVMRTWIQAQSETHRLEEGARSHRPVYDAIAARDPDRAREAMRIHMRITRSTLLDQAEEPT